MVHLSLCQAAPVVHTGDPTVAAPYKVLFRAAADSTLHDYEVLRRRFEEGLQQERKQYEY